MCCACVMLWWSEEEREVRNGRIMFNHMVACACEEVGQGLSKGGSDGRVLARSNTCSRTMWPVLVRLNFARVALDIALAEG